MGGVNLDASERAISRRTQDREHQVEGASQDAINQSRFPQILDKQTRVINLPMILREHYLQSLVHISSDGLREYTITHIRKWGALSMKVPHSQGNQAISTVWRRSILHEMLMG